MSTIPASSARLEATVDELYRHRFPNQIRAQRVAVWKILCQEWFARYIPKRARLLEVAAGYCEFINNVEADERVAIDLNPETRKFAAPGIVVHETAAELLGEKVPADYFDTVFISNFLEHCRSRDSVLAVLRAAATALKPTGRVLILGPNFRYCYKDYFDYFDHYLPLTEQAVVEAIRLAGLEPEVVQARTLPYSFRGKLPSWPILVRMYLRMPWLWRFFGAQFFVVGRKVPPGEALRVFRPLAA